jgi:hypothetical protein
MAEQTELTQDELEAEQAEQLPEREAMSIVDLGDPGTMTAAPVPVDSFDEADGIPTREVHDPATPPF